MSGFIPTKDHGMLFKSDMVCGVLNDIKTETRRLITANNSLIDGHGGGVCGLKKKDIFALPEFLRDSFIDPGPSPAGNKGPYLKCPISQNDTIHRLYPRIQVGDRIWVKETWKISGWDEDYSTVILRFRAGDGKGYADYDEENEKIFDQVIRHCDKVCDELDALGYVMEGGDEGRYNTPPGLLPNRWHSSMLMPRWASRILLEVVAVWPERLQDISNKGAIAEGVKKYGDENCYKIYTPTTSFGTISPRVSYQSLWDSINANNGHSWEQNDLVWVYQFKKIDG